ncbi:MAG: hypothetical protein J6S85_02630 [Methanobrevibacter sp.]|nr:hypothetical protein [Methanobrevibacter sp.]MBO7712435.1 hypothetical protein [Methanobrevibacter sp.]
MANNLTNDFVNAIFNDCPDAFNVIIEYDLPNGHKAKWEAVYSSAAIACSVLDDFKKSGVVIDCNTGELIYHKEVEN